MSTFTFKTISFCYIELTVTCLNYFPNQRKQYRFKKKLLKNILVLYLVCSGSAHPLPLLPLLDGATCLPRAPSSTDKDQGPLRPISGLSSPDGPIHLVLPGREGPVPEISQLPGPCDNRSLGLAVRTSSVRVCHREGGTHQRGWRSLPAGQTRLLRPREGVTCLGYVDLALSAVQPWAHFMPSLILRFPWDSLVPAWSSFRK